MTMKSAQWQKGSKVGLKLCQMLKSLPEICKGLLKFCQSSEFWSHCTQPKPAKDILGSSRNDVRTNVIWQNVLKADFGLITLFWVIISATRFCEISPLWQDSKAKPWISLTAPNRDYYEQVSLTVLDFLDAIAKAKKLIHKSIAQNLKQVSLTKSFLALAMAFNLLLSNLT